ncbi:MAG TPA: tetratricopeptide repeat protein, partial [Chryseosolibacter sp.]
DGSNPAPNTGRKSRTYFFIGFALLFVMAFTWSLDDSFVYTSLGAAVFFFFLAYSNRTHQGDAHYQKRPRQHNQNQDSFSKFFDSLRSQRGTASGKAQNINRQQENSRRFALMVMLFIGGIFFIIVLSVFFADDVGGEYANSSELYDKAEEARYSGNYDSAEYYYRKILADDPENLDALNGIGILSINRQHYDQAVNQFEDALRIDPDFKFARYNKALTFYYQKNFRKSLGEAFNLLQRTPDYYDAMQLAGDNYYEQQRYDSAKYWYGEGYANGLRNAWICHVLGYLHDRDNETDRAIELYKEAVSYDESKVDVYVRLGELLPGKEGDVYRAKAAQLKSSN